MYNFNQNSGISSLVPQQQLLQQPQGQANQAVTGPAASQLGNAVGLPPAGQPMGPPQEPTQWMMPQVPRKTPVLGLPAMASGGVVPAQHKDRIVKEAQLAVMGKHPNARHAISQFEQTMGPDATNDLIRAHATGGRIRGSGGGVDDLVPGSIDGREDVRLASGEYVIPARVVSALGDGDSDRGAQILDEFCTRVRQAASEKVMGSDPINAQDLLPQG